MVYSARRCPRPGLSALARFLVLVFGASATTPLAGANPLPIVLWHGMGDTCCNPASMGAITRVLQGTLPGVYVHSIKLGATEQEDQLAGFYGNVNEQVVAVCDQLRNVKELSGGFNAIGFSQGGQFLRAVLQRCQQGGPQMRTLITFGGQHQGIIAPPGCDQPPSAAGAAAVPGSDVAGVLPTGLLGPRRTPPRPADPPDDDNDDDDDNDPTDDQPSDAAARKLLGVPRAGSMRAMRAVGDPTICRAVGALLARGAYSPWVRDHVVQAQYWKASDPPGAYLEHSAFLADINNERDIKNAQYAANMRTLERLVLVRFAEDAMMVPRDSAWFGEYSAVTRAVVPMRDTPLYKEDWIGLKALDQLGRITLLEAPGAHMQLSIDYFVNQIVIPFLTTSPVIPSGSAGEAACGEGMLGIMCRMRYGGVQRKRGRWSMN